MTSLTLSRPSRLLAGLRHGLFGTLATAFPVTSVLALGWLQRRGGWLIRQRFGIAAEPPGWISGPREAAGRETGRLARALGGLAANLRAGAGAGMALAVWTLPFSALWLASWWAGWENSFNKGYEQAVVGPALFLIGSALAALVLPLMPLMLAHLAVEDRPGAAFEVRRLRGVVAQAGWRVPALMLATGLAALPLLGMRVAIATATSIWPEIETLTPEQVAGLQVWIAIGQAAWAFLALALLRGMAARVYARAAPRAAGLRPGLWDGALAAEAAVPAARARLAVLWYGMAAVLALAIPAQVLVGQFFDHAWHRWALHPMLTLPWPG